MNGSETNDRGAAAPTTITVRPEVARFAEAMEKKLAANDHKPHWRGEWIYDLAMRLFDEFVELCKAMNDGDDSESIVSEAVDVANFAMMIADVARQAKEGE